MTSPIEIELSRDGRTTEAGQQRIRAALHGNTLALEHIKQFLNYSNTVLGVPRAAAGAHEIRREQKSLRKSFISLYQNATGRHGNQ